MDVYEKYGIGFLKALDLSENLSRATQYLRKTPNGVISLILAILALFPTLALAALAFYFDIDATWSALATLRSLIETRLAEISTVFAGKVLLVLLVQLVPFAITLLPTTFELLGSRLARFDIAVFQVLTWFFILFDAITDIPRVNALSATTWAPLLGEGANYTIFQALLTFNPEIIAASFAYSVLWVLGLFAASFFLELATILMLWIFCGLLFKSVGYWIIKLFAGSEWAKEFNRTGGFDAYSVRSGVSDE